MSSEISVSYRLPETGTVKGPTSAGSAAPLVAFADCELIGVDAAIMVMINRQNGRQQLIAPNVVDALKTCTFFDTIENHARRLCETRAELKNQQAVVVQTLNQLHAAGFFLEAETICERLNVAQPADKAATRVFIITCDRPALLKRLLESMLRAGGLTRHDDLVVIDDSREVENAAANERIVEDFNITSAKTLRYFGSEAQRELLDGLVRSLPEHTDGIRFLIDRERWEGQATYGRSRTLCLLLSVGYRAIVLDDDILCQAIAPPLRREGVFLGSGGNREVAFYDNRETLMASALAEKESPLDLHARCLGATLGECASGLNGGPLRPAQLAGANAAMSNVWRADSRVLISQCGSWGDPGTGNAHWTLNLSRDSVERLLSAPVGITAAIEGRNVWLGTPQSTIMKMAFMSQMTGLDNSQLLPPYFPVFRGEDLLFAAMVEAMHPHGAVVEYDFAVPHLPEERSRKSLRDPIAGAGDVGLFARYLTEQIDYTDGDNPRHRLGLLAQDLRRLADKSTDNLLLDYRREVAKVHAHQLLLIREQLAQSKDLPSNTWQGYLNRGVEEVQQALARAWSPTEITGAPRDSSDTAMMEAFRDLLRGFAAALEAWPAVRDIADEQARRVLDAQP
jgi:hypothetical protein